MVRYSLLCLTAFAALATPAIAGNPPRAGITNTQPCVTNYERKSEGHAIGIPAPADTPRSDGTMRNGLLPNQPSYG